MRARHAPDLLPLAVPALVAMLLGGCTGDSPQQYAVADLRVLAIRDRVVPAAPISLADLDPSMPGDRLELSALAVNPGGPAPSVDWYGCSPLLTSPIPSCLDPEALARPASFPGRPDVFFLGSGSTATVDLATPALAPISTGIAQSQALLLAAAIGTPELACSLYVELPVVAIASAGGAVQVAVKRVRILPPAASVPPTLLGLYVRNQNPVIDSIRVGASDPSTCGATDGTAVTASLPPGSLTLCGHPTDSSKQLPNLCRPGVAPVGVPEELEWQWYVSGGKISNADFDGNASGVSIDLAPAAGPFTLWAILRDGRGGSDWLELSF